MENKTIFKKGRTPYIIDAIAVISVCDTNSIPLRYEFNTNSKRLRILDTNYTTNDRLYGKKYKITYVEDVWKVRNDKIENILK